MTFLSKISKIFNRQAERIITENTGSKTVVPYNEVGIFNAYLAENNAMYSYTPDIPPNGFIATPEMTPIPTPSSLEETEPVQHTPSDKVGISDETTGIEESTEITEEEPVEKPPYVQGRDENIPVRVVIDGKETYFTYNVAVLEDYAISHSHIRKGSKEGWFENIPEIRAKAPEDRTEEEANKLEEFDRMIKYIVEIGVEYGVEPNFIASIIRKEIGFDGMLENWAYTVNGLGYMQLTTIAIKDMFMYPDKYGDELAEVMDSRGFDIHCPKSQRDSMVKKVMQLLKTNEDPEFNIRLGTIKLRRLLNVSHGDIQKAAKNYNGNTHVQNGQEIRVIYSKKAKEYYNELTARSK